MGNKKMKKAFCEPGNVKFCPVLAWTDALLVHHKELLIKRKPDNGGDKTYTDVKSVQADYASGALHPGDLKPAVGKLLNVALENMRTSVKASKELQKAQKDLDAIAKAKAKKKCDVCIGSALKSRKH